MRYFLLGVIAASGLSAAAGAAVPQWRITEASGNVQVLHAGISRVAQRGGVLAAGDLVVTGARSRAVITRGEEFMMVAAGSRLRLPAEAKPGAITQLIEEAGNVVFMIRKKATPHFGVQTPYLAAVVKGTTFSVSVTPKGATVKVLEGAVDVATLDGGAHQLLKPGALALVDATDKLSLRVREGGREKHLKSDKKTPDAPGKMHDDVTTSAKEDAGTEAAAANDDKAPPQSITVAVNEEPVSLSSATDGLVKDAPGTELAAVVDKLEDDKGKNEGADYASLPSPTVVQDAIATAKHVTDGDNSGALVEKAVAAAGKKADEAGDKANDAADAAAKAQDAADAAAAKAAELAAAAQASGDDAAKKAADDAAKAAEKAQKAAEDAAKKSAEEAAKAEQAAADAAAKLADKAAKDAADALKDSQDAAKKAAEAAAKAEKEAADAAKKAAEQAAKAASDAEKALADAAKKAAEDAAKAAEEADKAAAELAKKAAEDAAKAAKLAEEAAKQAGKGLGNLLTGL